MFQSIPDKIEEQKIFSGCLDSRSWKTSVDQEGDCVCTVSFGYGHNVSYSFIQFIEALLCSTRPMAHGCTVRQDLLTFTMKHSSESSFRSAMGKLRENIKFISTIEIEQPVAIHSGCKTDIQSMRVHGHDYF